MSGPTGEQPSRRYRRRALAWGAAGLAVIAVGVVVFVGLRSSPDDDATPTSAPAAVTTETGGDDNRDDEATSTAPTSTALATTSTTQPSLPSLFDLIADDPQFSSLETAVGAAGLFDELENGGPYTVFAPSNAAFEALDPEVAGRLNADADLLASVLLHHGFDGAVPSGDLPMGDIEMLDGTTILFASSPDGVTLTDAESTALVTDADLMADNGVLNVVDHVLLPSNVEITDPSAAVGVAADLVDGAVTLAGSIDTEEHRTVLLDAAALSLDRRNIVDLLTVDPAVVVEPDAVATLAALVERLPIDLVEGQVRLDGLGLSVTGVYVDDDALARIESTAGVVQPVRFDLRVRPVADASSAASISEQVGALLSAEPLLFEGLELASPESAATLDRLAAIVKQASGIDVAVVGFTDTSGDAATNLAVSIARAELVADELFRRGVPPADVGSAGFGEAAPVLVDGVEDRAASRRVAVVVKLR